MPEYLTLAEAAKKTPGRPSARCLWRWCRRGLRTRSGGRCFLKHLRVGARVFTTDDWLQAFFAELDAGDAQHFRPDQAPEAAGVL